MLKCNLVDSVLQVLSEAGFRLVDCRGSRSSFDVLARGADKLLLVKALANVEGLSRDSVAELKSVANLLDGVVVIVSDRMKSSELVDGAVYDRYGVCVCNIGTFEGMVNDSYPKFYSTRGNYCVHVNTRMLAEARHSMGLTQDSLAEKLGVTKQSIYRYERSGRVSLDVFERLVALFGEGIIERDFRLSGADEGERPKAMEAATDLKRMVRGEFESMGFKTALTNAPFDMVASREKRVFSVVSNDWRRLEGKLSLLEQVTAVVDGYTVCISERRVKSSVSVLSPHELSQIRSSKELFKLLSD